MNEFLLKRLVLNVLMVGYTSLTFSQTDGVFQAKILPNHSRSSVLTNEFRQVILFELDVQKLDEYVHQDSYDGELHLSIGERFRWNLVLFEHDLRSTNWQARIGHGGQIDVIPKLRNSTYRGSLVNQAESVVRLSIDGHFFCGMIDNGQHRYFIEPLGNYLPSSSNHYVLYRSDDVRSDDRTSLCGTVSAIQATTHLNHARTQPASCLLAEIAIALDYSFVSHHGGYTNAVNQALSVLNNLDPNFDSAFDSDIDFEVVELFAATSASEDPPEWTNTVDGDILLQNFRSWGNSGGFISDFDLGQLWTKRNFHYEDNYGVVGLAYIGTTCYYSRFHLLEHYTSNADKLRVLTAHEIGHNFGAGHDTLTAYIMKPSVNPSATSFSQMSIDIVNNSLPNRTCLTDCNLSCPEGVTISIDDPMGNYDAGSTIRTIGTVNVNTNSIFDAPEVQLYPNFSSDIGITFEIRTDGCN